MAGRSSGRRLQRRRLNLWLKDPRCAYCGTITVLRFGPMARQPERLATIDHLRSRYHPGRQAVRYRGEVRTVLACRLCNQLRGRMEQAIYYERYVIDCAS